jgi:hypothetical protein
MTAFDAAAVAQHSASSPKFTQVAARTSHDVLATDPSGHTQIDGIFTSWHIRAAYPILATHTPLFSGSQNPFPKQLNRALGATPPFRGSVRRGALPVSGPSHTSSTAVKSSILAGSTPGEQV